MAIKKERERGTSLVELIVILLVVLLIVCLQVSSNCILDSYENKARETEKKRDRL